MNKNLKRIIAITMAMGMISATGPANKINLLTSKVYASTSNTVATLSSLGLETSGGSTINTYSDSSYSTAVSSTSISAGITYYAESSSRSVRVNISGPASEYVKVFNDTSSSTEGKSVSSSISISSGTTTLVVRVYDTEPASNIKYSSDSHVVSEYRIKVKYSTSSSSDNQDELDSLKLENSSGDTINLYDDDSYDSDNKVDSDEVESDTDYYAKTSSNTVQVHISGVSSKYVRVFKGTGNDDISDSAKSKEVGDDLSLSSGTNTLVVRVYNDEPDNDVEYDDDDDVECDYTIYVDCTGDGSSDSSDTSDDNADNYDDIYLDSLSIDGNSISLSDSKVTYTYNASSDADSVTIKAKPEDEDNDTVEIDGDEVDDSDNYKKDVDLNNGENDIKVKIQDEDDNEREYTLKIYRGSSSTDSSSSSSSTSSNTNTASSTSNTATTVSTGNATTTTVSTANKVGWVQANGKWQYYDNLGKQLINQWAFDKNYNSWYYMGADGFMSENSWILSGGKYYYLNADGSMAENCWVVSGGKYYYLNSDGSMAANTTINGYKVGSDGAWIR